MGRNRKLKILRFVCVCVHVRQSDFSSICTPMTLISTVVIVELTIICIELSTTLAVKVCLLHAVHSGRNAPLESSHHAPAT